MKRRTAKPSAERGLYDSEHDAVNRALREPITDALKAAERLSPVTFCMAHLLDYRLTYEEVVVPALQRGAVVISDRYVYTSWVRDRPRGVSPHLLGGVLQKFL